ncbi:N-(5'-phosphoribosyl)anthranilate isomerase [Achromatium sp. WMS2]|nr:N-(5'-phosphoribosyl)anthranilate isomerase [Achromatium sp. WMS2]
MRTRIKICGITRNEDAVMAAKLGADAIGLVFYPPSSRAITIKQAQDIVASLPPFVTVVGLFVNERRERIIEVLNAVRIDLLQFHGDETPIDCVGYNRPWIKAIAMRKNIKLAPIISQYGEATAILLDTYIPGIPGGTGSSFDWNRIPPHIRPDIILSGGLTPETVEDAICQVRPYAVDVSGGVELSQGIKDHKRMQAFIRGVIRAEQKCWY